MSKINKGSLPSTIILLSDQNNQKTINYFNTKTKSFNYPIVLQMQTPLTDKLLKYGA